VKTMVESSFEVAENTFNTIIVGKMRIMRIKIQACWKHKIVRAGDGEVLVSTGETVVKSSIR
jgi:GDP-D-mannose dehydratase